MPAPICADWEAVKATAIATNSIKDAAELHGVTYEAARQRASREAWMVGRRPAKAVEQAKQVHQEQLAKVSPQSVTSVTSTSAALVKGFEGQKQKSRSLLAKYVLNASKVAARSRKPLADAQNVRHVAAVHSALWPEEQKNAGLTLNLGIQLG